MRRRVLALLLAASPAAAGELRAAEEAVRRAIRDVRPAVVTVLTPHPKDCDLTGAIVSQGGLVVTVRGPLLQENGTLPKEVAVRYPGRGDTASLPVVDDDAASDTVLLLPPPPAHGPYLRIADSGDVHPGMWVVLVGNAFGAGQESTPTASLGVVSGLVGSRDAPDEVHASALVNPGSVGAPVVDLQGRLVGITAPRTTGAGGQTVLIPFDRVRRAYLAKGGAGARALGQAPRERRLGGTVADAFGLVVADAAARGSAVLVGVRAGALAEDAAPPAPPAAPAAGEPKQPAPPPRPEPVPGLLEGRDRSSGVVVSASGWVLCPLRVTGWPGPPRPLTVDLPDGRAFAARVLGTDDRLRLALLGIDAKGLPAFEAAPEEAFAPGRLAIALGFPHEDPERASPQVTVGIVSRTGALAQLHPAFEAVQTDAGVAGGNRGGPLVDAEGRLLGVLLDVHDADLAGYVTRLRGSCEGNAGLGFAVPVRVLLPLLPRLAAGANLRAGFLGVGVEPAEGGLRVVAVTATTSAGAPTAAAAAGLAPGDLLLSLGGSPLDAPASLRDRIGRRCAGDEIEIVFDRGGERRAVRVTLTER
jgi:S1-C subfamily serine protease